MKAKLILENGAVFQGESIGAARDSTCEIVINTSMVGYQEILTDPAYAGQGVVMTYPLMGNYGVNSEDSESERCWADAMIVRRMCQRGSNFRCEKTLDAFLKEQNVTGICGVDTRAITRLVREEGCMNGLITTREDVDVAAVCAQLSEYRISNAVAAVTRSEPVIHEPKEQKAKVAVYDFGVIQSQIDALVDRGCQVTVLPAKTPADIVLQGGYDGVMLSNGPGNPADCAEIVGELKKIFDSDMPMFAIGLGHQLLALAVGAKTEKMKYGHRGGNYPVRDEESGLVFITMQNHGYVVIPESVDPTVAEICFTNANDNTVEGLRYCRGNVLAVQFYPEAVSGLAGIGNLFDRFMNMMEENGHA